MDQDFEWQLRRGLASTLQRVLGGDDSALARVNATCQLALTTARHFAAAVAAARAAGRSWEEIADHAPAVAPGAGAAQALFEQLAIQGSAVGAYVSWRCDSCHALVVDRGPYGGHPDDAEPGHAPGCERARAELRAYVDGLCHDGQGADSPDGRADRARSRRRRSHPGPGGAGGGEPGATRPRRPPP